MLEWSVEEVVEWLREDVKLPQYAESFSSNYIYGELLVKLDKEALKGDLNVQPLGHREMLLAGIKKLVGGGAPADSRPSTASRPSASVDLDAAPSSAAPSEAPPLAADKMAPSASTSEPPAAKAATKAVAEPKAEPAKTATVKEKKGTLGWGRKKATPVAEPEPAVASSSSDAAAASSSTASASASTEKKGTVKEKDKKGTTRKNPFASIGKALGRKEKTDAGALLCHFCLFSVSFSS